MGFSTVKALLAVIKDVVHGLDRGTMTNARLCDYAFDCVNMNRNTAVFRIIN